MGEGLALALAYYLCAEMGLRLAHVGSSVTLVWPPTGIAIAAFFRLGPRCWPGIFLGAALVNAQHGAPISASVIMGAGNTAGPALVAMALRRMGFRPFHGLRDALGFVGVASLGMTVAPSVGLLALQHAGLVRPGFFGAAWAMWWVGDLNGALIVGPMLLTLRRDALVDLQRRSVELVVIGVLAGAMSLVIFALPDDPVAFAALVPIVWASLRVPGLGSSTVVVFVSGVVVWATVSGRGQFASSDVRRGLLALSSFLGTAATANLVAMALLASQRRVQVALAASEAELQRALHAGALGMWDLDIQRSELTVDEGTAALWGVRRDVLEAQRERLIEGIHSADRAAVLAARREARQHKTTFEASYRVVRPDGSIRWVASRGKYFYDDAGKALRFAGVSRDDTERTLSEIARRGADDRLALAAQLAGFGTWQLDVATKRIRVSRELGDILDLSELDFGSVEQALELLHPDDRGTVDEMVRSVGSGSPFQVELRARRRDGTIRHLAVHGSGATANAGTTVLGAALDITGRKESEDARELLERRLMQLQKTEALGRLAGGIAHDFNNILAAILHNAEQLAQDLAPDHPGQEPVNDIRSATLRGRDLVKQILMFAKGRDPSDQVIELLPIVEQALALRRAAMPASIEVRTRLEACRPVRADPSQLHRIIMNLATNAQHAMRASGGVLEVSLREVDVSEALAVPHQIEPGRFALLEVSDTGHGIDAATLPRIFDPFFTTKEPGEGTGLGLSLVHAIVRSYGGAVDVRSAVGRGTTFSAYLPTSADAVEVELARPRLAPAGGRERLLVVDDEPAVLASLRRLLVRLGYDVHAAAGPRAALALLADEAQKFDLLLTDMTMPEMTGVGLAAEARKRVPGLPVLIATGYAASVKASEASAAGVVEILEKPMTRDVLARAVRRAIDANARTEPGDGQGEAM